MDQIRLEFLNKFLMDQNWLMDNFDPIHYDLK